MDRALARVPHRKNAKPVTPEEIELALAWLQGAITVTQANAAMYPDESNPGAKVLYRFAVCLREAHRQGTLQVAA